ncbi:N-acetylmuramoyl-L-alanine amidase [Clostridium tetanomorphum]|nr:N-acetylmuramoyl-L-alanine amidase CwlD [Clostridium tetanomorphum]MBP1863734.1 N-acetylmuramoyl-L-alanine amidase [Clostridium tetanomorphum]NRS86310.1 N-acetylmuramoyl-L-alanine amidase [Clostridium tetanomorphum]
MMNKKRILSILMFIILGVLLFTNGYKLVYSKKNSNIDKKIILIDPGHGGIDGGAVSKNGTVEKDINLSISLKLRDELEKNEYKVIMTREEDKGLYSDKGRIRDKKREDLNNRCKMKQNSNCDAFISIHLNMFPESKYYGAQVWYSSNDNSKKLASLIQSNFKLNLDETNKRAEKPAKNDYKILRSEDDIPSVIVECGFLSNPNEERKLKDSKYQEDIANIIATSINQYFDNK